MSGQICARPFVTDGWAERYANNVRMRAASVPYPLRRVMMMEECDDVRINIVHLCFQKRTFELSLYINMKFEMILLVFSNI